MLMNYDDNSSGSSSDSTSKMADLVEKEIDQLIRNDRRTPKILKHIMWLVMFAFLATTVISAVIMGMFVGVSERQRGQVEVFEAALERGRYAAQVMTLLRAMVAGEMGWENVK
jgi:hypothetical protein